MDRGGKVGYVRSSSWKSSKDTKRPGRSSLRPSGGQEAVYSLGKSCLAGDSFRDSPPCSVTIDIRSTERCSRELQIK